MRLFPLRRTSFAYRVRARCIIVRFLRPRPRQSIDETIAGLAASGVSLGASFLRGSAVLIGQFGFCGRRNGALGR
jgi:hypothetical protein